MQDLTQLLDDLLAVAYSLAPVVEAVTGKGELVTAATTAARGVIDLVDRSIALFGATDQAKLTAAREQLQARVNAHADRTIASLGGSGA